MKVSERGIWLVQEFEGCSLEPYDDVGGKVTWGYGHLCRSGEDIPKKITEAEATALLCKDLEHAEAVVNGAVDAALSQNEFDALVCLAFNIGAANFNSSTLLRKLNSRDYKGAAAEFPRWCKVNGKDVPGLLRRRLAEQLLFTTP